VLKQIKDFIQLIEEINEAEPIAKDRGGQRPAQNPQL
jgi:hypothetical protein